MGRDCFLCGLCQGYITPVTNITVRAGSNTSTVTLRVVGGDERADQVHFSPGMFNLSLVIIFPPLFHVCRRLSSPVRQHSITSTLSKLVASSLARHLSVYGVNKLDFYGICLEGLHLHVLGSGYEAWMLPKTKQKC
jgi:hypothetical protein